jgi:peptide/nickel transport system substrate-binding protein
VCVVEQRDTLEQLLRDYRDAKLSRRDVMRRAAALGLSASAVAGLLLSARTSGAAAAPGGRTSARLGRAQEEPKVGGILREGYDLDFSRMDPINTNWYDPGVFALYDAIITNDPEGNFVPQLAESWEVSEDGTTVTFKIREGLTFHSGRPLTAQAIKEVYDTIQDPESGSPLAVLANPITSTEAPDDTTLILNMAHPYYNVLNVVKTGYWRIVNIETRRELGDEYAKQVIDGSGPFTFGEWVPGSHVTVNRWDDYPGSIVPYFENKGTAYLDGIRWVAILEAAQRAIQIENAEIDTLHAPAFQDVARLEANPDLNVIKLKEWSGYIFGVNFERTDLDFDKLEMRQAISMAINRDAIADALLFGEGEPLYGPITSADKFYTDEVRQYSQFDLDGARALVAELGWTPGDDGILEKNGVKMEFRMVIQAESFNQQLATVMQDQLRQLGMNVKVEAFDRGTYFNELSAGPDSWIFFYLWPVPIDVVILFVGSGTIPAPNWARASIAEVDAAIDAWQHAANEDELRAAGEQFQLAVARNLPIIPILNRNNIWVNRKNVHGYLPHQWNLYPYYNDVWLE